MRNKCCIAGNGIVLVCELLIPICLNVSFNCQTPFTIANNTYIILLSAQFPSTFLHHSNQNNS